MPKVPDALTAANTPASQSGVAAIHGGSSRNLFAAHGIQSHSQQEISQKQELAWQAYDNIGEMHYLGNGVVGASWCAAGHHQVWMLCVSSKSGARSTRSSTPVGIPSNQ